MIVEITKKTPKVNKYGNYFLSVEAPGDEDGIVNEEQDVTPAPKSNTKIINIKPRKSRVNFADGADIEDEDPYNSSDVVPADSNEWTSTPMANEWNNQPVGAETTPIDNSPVPVDGSTAPVGPDMAAEPVDTSMEPTVQEIDPMNPAPIDLGGTDNPNFADGADMGDEVAGGGQPVGAEGNEPIPDETGGQPVGADTGEQPVGAEPAPEGETGEGPDVGAEGNEEDFAAGSEDTSGEETGTTDTGGETPPAEKKGPGIEYDSTRKYNLFQNFMSLLNAIDNYIERLEGFMNDDYEMNQVLKTVIDKLREIRELTYDYLMMKFELSTYIQSLLFYQNQVIMVQLTFSLLERGQKISQKQDSK